MGFVSKNGLEIIPTDKRNHPKDFETKDHQFIPYQFQYNGKNRFLIFSKKKRPNPHKLMD
jgi:hypothetical protein